MIAGEIGEGAGSEAQAVEPRLGKTMARRLERDMGDTFLDELPQHPMEVDGIGVVWPKDRLPEGETTPTVPMLAAPNPIISQI